MIGLTGRFVPIPQDEPKEGRMGIPLLVNGADMNFVTGTETFQYNSNSFIAGGVRLSGILSVFIDASAIPTGKNVAVSNGLITVIVAGGDQTYALIPTSMPGIITITSPSGGTGVVKVVLFNFNINAMGTYVTQGSGSSGNSGGSGGGSGIGSGGGVGGAGASYGGTSKGGTSLL